MTTIKNRYRKRFGQPISLCNLYLLAEILENVEKTLQIYDLPILQLDWHPLNDLIGQQLAYNFWHKVICFRTILRIINSNYLKNPHFFIQSLKIMQKPLYILYYIIIMYYYLYSVDKLLIFNL